MTDHTLIAAVSATLKALFETAITSHSAPGLNGMLIDLRSPRDMRLDNESLGLSVWLYRVDAHANPRSLVPTRPLLGQPAAVTPLLPELHYLVTPVAASVEDEQAMLGRVLETLRDHPVLTGDALRGALAGSQHEIRLTSEMLTLDETIRLWQALQEPYRTAVACQARLVERES
jgi:hypothetical protein